MFNKKTKLENAFRCILSQVNWKERDLPIYKSLMDWNDNRGGLTVKQLQLLGKMYARYGEPKRER